MPGVTGVTVVTMLVCFFTLHARLRARRAPGIPCSLYSRGWPLAKLGRFHAARMRRCVFSCRRGGFCRVKKLSAFVNQLLRGAPASARKSRVLRQNGSLDRLDVSVKQKADRDGADLSNRQRPP